jgi:hypothetical protein
MKTHLLFLFLFFVKLSCAQDWIHKGSEWVYIYSKQVSSVDFVKGYEKFKYDKDTSLSGLVCKKVKANRVQYSYDQLGQVQYYSDSWNVFSYSDSGKVFFLEASDFMPTSFYPLYTFNPNIGDSIIDSYIACCGCRQNYFINLAKGNKTINGFNLKYYTVRSTSPSNGVLDTFDVIERIGAISLFNKNNRQCPVGELDYYTLSSYKDDSFGVYHNISCDAYYATAYDSVQNNFNLFISPVTSVQSASYYWDFGDGTTSNLPAPSHNYGKDSLYNVCMKVYASSGDSCEYCHIIGKDGSGNVIRNRGFTLNVEKENLTSVSSIKVSDYTVINIYPNPFGDKASVEFGQPQVNTIVSIINTIGEVVQTRHVMGSQLIIEREGLDSGVYFLRIMDSLGNKTIKKAVIQY